MQRREIRRPQARLRPGAAPRPEGGGTAGARRLGNCSLGPGFSESPKSGAVGEGRDGDPKAALTCGRAPGVPADSSVW